MPEDDDFLLLPPRPQEGGWWASEDGTTPSTLEGYIFEGVEIDIPYCTRTWGNAPCTAALSVRFPRKCWNLLRHCGDPTNYLAGSPITLRLCKPGPMPHGEVWFPVLTSIRRSSQTVNVAGTDPDSSPFGRQATLSIEADEFLYHERGIDPYQAERLTGAAQFDTLPIDPETTDFLTKIKARWPYYADAAMRHVTGYLIDGQLTQRRNISYFMKDWQGPNRGGHTINARGVTDFANKKTALAPKPSPGRLTLDLTAVATTFDITPAGSGDSDYAASGWVCVGSEVMAFTRAADTFTVTRGQRRTTAATHSQGDTVQQVLAFRNARLDEVVHTLVRDYTDTPADYLRDPVAAANTAEVNRWGATVLVETDVCQPTGVDKLLGELGPLGATVWEDQVNREFRIKMTRPLDGDATITRTDAMLRDIEVQDDDERRLTQVLFCFKRIDPTKGLEDEANYATRLLTVDPDLLTRYGSVRNRTIYCRWLDNGDEVTPAISSLRLLDRLRDAPKAITLRLDGREQDYPLTGVMALQSAELAGPDGIAATQYVQIIQTSEPVAYHDVEALVQAFPFGDRRYGYIGPDTLTNTYDIATNEEKLAYAFIAPDTGLFADGTEAYRVI